MPHSSRLLGARSLDACSRPVLEERAAEFGQAASWFRSARVRLACVEASLNVGGSEEENAVSAMRRGT